MNNTMVRSLGRASAVTIAACLAVTSQAQLVDDFSGNLSAYSDVRILNNGNHAPVNSYTWEIASGALQLNTTAFTGIEQFALTRTDFSLAVGMELRTDFNPGYTGTQDVGLYVGAGTPTVDVRANYVNVYVRNNGQIFSRGFNGTTEFGLAGGATPANIDSLFVTRTAVDTFELGYYDGVTRTVLTTRTIASGNAAGIGSAIGFYADVRALGIVGNLDNLTLAVPEPSSATLFGLGALLSVLRLRRKK
jgi:hypothetical protein